jgi:hypothetical protein
MVMWEFNPLNTINLSRQTKGRPTNGAIKDEKWYEGGWAHLIPSCSYLSDNLSQSSVVFILICKHIDKPHLARAEIICQDNRSDGIR